MSKTTDYQSYLLATLKDPDEAANYLNAALEDGDKPQQLSKNPL